MPVHCILRRRRAWSHYQATTALLRHPGAITRYCVWPQAFLLGQQWWHGATHEVPGVSPHHEDVVSFIAWQMLDICSPSDTPFTNPETIERARKTGGANFQQGFHS